MKYPLFALLVLLSLVLAGCNLPSAPATPTALTPDSPEATDPAAATATPTSPDATQPAPVTAAPDPTATPETVTVPTNTAAAATAAPPDKSERPEETIMILEPAPGSRVTSPVRIVGWSDSTFEQNLVVRVVTADGAQVALAPTTIQSELGQRGPFELVLPLPLTGEHNLFIQVYADSPRDGGITHLSAVGVLFNSAGGTDVRTRGPYPEQIEIHTPRLRDVIRGGAVRVEGFALASFEQTLVIDVQDENGHVIGSTPVMVQAPDLGQPGPFSATVSYSLSQAGPGRIVVRDISPAFGGDVHLSSVEVQLEP